MQAQPSTSTSAAAKTSTTSPQPQQLTACICSTTSVHKLAKLIDDNSDDLNMIHVAASIVRLANLVGGGGTAAATAAGDSWDQHGDDEEGVSKGVNGAAKRQTRMRDATFKQLMLTLGQKYVDFCGQGLYTGARQHANIAWAIGKIGEPLPPGLIEELTSQLLEQGCRRLKAASPQVSIIPQLTTALVLANFHLVTNYICTIGTLEPRHGSGPDGLHRGGHVARHCGDCSSEAGAVQTSGARQPCMGLHYSALHATAFVGSAGSHDPTGAGHREALC